MPEKLKVQRRLAPVGLLDCPWCAEIPETAGFGDGLGFFKCRPCHLNPKIFVAWAALIPMTDSDPATEPAEPLWFAFGTTEYAAITRVKSEVERELGIGEWQRQEA